MTMPETTLERMKRLSSAIVPSRWRLPFCSGPVSTLFGLDRGLPIDRWYIECFLRQEKEYIRGRVLEVADRAYTKAFGQHVAASEVLHATHDNPHATIFGNLCDPSTLPQEAMDCFICTQTFHVVYDVGQAIRGAHFLLKPGGVLLATLPGISQISRYDMDRWGDYWRFTDAAVRRLFGDVFGDKNVAIRTYGNITTACAFLQGLAAHELPEKQLRHHDPDYQVLIAVRAIKREAAR
jgi:SAM-dependent methyltransferase